VTENTGFSKLVGGKGGIFFHFMMKMKKREVEVADCCCQSGFGARVPRGTGGLRATSLWVLPPSLGGMNPSGAHACRSGSLNKPLGTAEARNDSQTFPSTLPSPGWAQGGSLLAASKVLGSACLRIPAVPRAATCGNAFFPYFFIFFLEMMLTPG